MVEMNEMDPNVSIQQQVAEDGGPVVLINEFHVPAEAVEEFLKVWEHDASIMKRQPGFIATQLYRGTAGSTTFINNAVWETVEAFRNAFGNPEFRANLGNYPQGSKTSPHLFRKVAVKDICVE